MFAPVFLPFDGHRIELDDESVDRVVCVDALHRVPNVDEVIGEQWPVLVLALSDPGTAVKLEGINYFADTLLFAGTILALASASPVN